MFTLQGGLLFRLNTLRSHLRSSVSVRNKLQGLVRDDVVSLYLYKLCESCCKPNLCRETARKACRDRRTMEECDSPSQARGSHLLFGHGLFVLRLHHIKLRLLVIQLPLGLLQVLHGQDVAILLHHQVGLHRTHRRQGMGRNQTFQ